jgi:hypothetical protein
VSKLLLHTCCAPCTTFVYKWLIENKLESEGLFYNPNIRPEYEYQKRLETMQLYSATVGLKVTFEPNDQQIEPEKCEDCYRVRLEKTASLASVNGFKYFSTTLLISPYQKHALLKRAGEEAGEKSGVVFYYHDFREDYNESRRMAQMMGLYRQKYCGCRPMEKAKGEKHAKISQPA